jgi:hypothetical protein
MGGGLCKLALFNPDKVYPYSASQKVDESTYF